MCVVYFRSDCLALHRCLEVQKLWLINASSWKALAHMLDPKALWSYCYHQRQHCWIWRRMWQQQAQPILSGGVRATSWPYADSRSATRLLILHTPCRGKPGLKVRSWKIPVTRRSAAGILLHSHQEKRRGRGVHDSSQILCVCLSHWLKTQ